MRQLADRLGRSAGSLGVALFRIRRALATCIESVIGKVSRVYAWSHKNWGFDGDALPDGQLPPESLAWDLWLGTAENRAFGHLPIGSRERDRMKERKLFIHPPLQLVVR